MIDRGASLWLGCRRRAGLLAGLVYPGVITWGGRRGGPPYHKMRTRKSWREKLEKIQEPKVVTIPPKMRKRFGEGTMLIPRPLDVDAMIRTVKRGSLITQAQIRTALAGRFHADGTCPICTRIFVRIAAAAAA